MKKIISLYIIFICLQSLTLTAQNVSSPYSVLGIGDLQTSDYSRYSSIASTSLARRDVGFYNFSNPASLTSMNYKSVSFDFPLQGRISQFKLVGADTLTRVTKDIVIKQLSLSFKPSKTTAYAFGLKPFSSVNYKYYTLGTISDGTTSYIKNTDGSGGINQAYISGAKEFGRHFSVGLTGSWLFGSLESHVEYYNPNINLDVIKQEDKFYNATGALLGLQYYSTPGKKWQHSFGVTGSMYTKLSGHSYIDYTENDVLLDSSIKESSKFELPISVGAGYTAANKSGLSINLQGNYQKWTKQKLSYKNSYTTDAYRISAGMEYSKRGNLGNLNYERYYLGWGVKMEQSYLMLNNQHLNDYSVTLGGGKNISWMLSINGGIEVGRRGTANWNQIQETYYQFFIGLTLRDIWFNTRKFGD